MSALPQLVPNPHRLPLARGRAGVKISPAQLQEYIQALERACDEDPSSADLRTCLGMALAMKNDVRNAIQTLEQAIALDEGHFYARLKYAELFQMLDLLPRAEAETRRALDLAHNGWEFSMARKQLHAIRQSLRERAQATGDWSKFVTGQCLLALVALYMFIIAAIVR